MNALFSPTDESMVLTNQSIFAQQQMNSETCSLSRRTTKHFSLTALIADQNPNCNIYGNFFVSKGLREQVLEVKAKKRIGRDFIDALQHAICRFPHKTDSQLMGKKFTRRLSLSLNNKKENQRESNICFRRFRRYIHGEK